MSLAYDHAYQHYELACGPYFLSQHCWANKVMPVQLRLLSYLNYFLAACVILSDGLYLFYRNSGGDMLRY